VNARSIRQYTGLPFKVNALVASIHHEMQTVSGKLARV